jgi:hypothetical protein
MQLQIDWVVRQKILRTACDLFSQCSFNEVTRDERRQAMGEDKRPDPGDFRD